MGLEGAVADTAELGLLVQYAPSTSIYLIHWQCERWPTLSCAECRRAAKGKYLVPRVGGREYRQNTNEHKSKYDKATTHKGSEYLRAL